MQIKCRIKEKFDSLSKKKQAGLICFITAGDPDNDTCAKILHKLPNAGVDLIELGMPFSDPMADGPVIQNSYKRALANGNTMSKTIKLVKNFRRINNITPLILMGYYNPIYQLGVEKFFKKIKKAGVDGILIVDLPPEAVIEIYKFSQLYEVKLIHLATPTTDSSRLGQILKHASGFLYYVSITGITGSRISSLSNIEKNYKKLKKK